MILWPPYISMEGVVTQRNPCSKSNMYIYTTCTHVQPGIWLLFMEICTKEFHTTQVQLFMLDPAFQCNWNALIIKSGTLPNRINNNLIFLFCWAIYIFYNMIKASIIIMTFPHTIKWDNFSESLYMYTLMKTCN